MVRLPRQTGERIEQDHHIGTVFDEALRALDHELGNRDVVLAGHIERRRNDLASDGSLHIGYFLGALVDEQAHEVHFGVVGRNGSRDILEDRGLARLRGRDDEAALAFADGGGQIDDACRDGVLAVLHPQTLVGIDRREIGEADTFTEFIG